MKHKVSEAVALRLPYEGGTALQWLDCAAERRILRRAWLPLSPGWIRNWWAERRCLRFAVRAAMLALAGEVS